MCIRYALVQVGVILALIEASAHGQSPGTDASQSPARPAVTSAARWQATGQNGAVAAGGLKAVEAGIELLKAGGNAVDAAVATILALSVTDATSFCFGGEVPILIYTATTRDVTVVAGQGAAPTVGDP